MFKRVVLKLEGDLAERGFQVTLTMDLGQAQESRVLLETSGHLPPDPDLASLLQSWQATYRQLVTPTRIIRPQKITYEGSLHRDQTCRNQAQALVSAFQRWLQAPSFQPVSLRLREELGRRDSIQLLLQTGDRSLSQLPWHRWDFAERYPNVEVSFAPLAVEPVLEAATAVTVDRPKVRILAILGNSTGIDVTADRQLLSQLPDAEIHFLVEPQRQQLTEHLWSQPWDILFFAGHSFTEAEVGHLQINPADSLTIEDVRYGVQRAINHGLQLAVFNSCQGLGLAHALGDLQLPQLIVMREPVPDAVAQHFLMRFLQAFASGQSFYQSVRAAREQLQGWEQEYPCASWLPVIYQNLKALPPTWDSIRRRRPTREPNFKWLWILASGTLASVLVILLRLGGGLQGAELQGFDRLMQQRPSVGLDERIVLVEVTAADVLNQPGDERRGSSLTDTRLRELLERLETYNPRVVALDLYRDFSANDEALAQRLAEQDNLIAICNQHQLIAKPPELAGQSGRLGYSNAAALDNDDVIRRQILVQNPGSEVDKCPTPYSLPLVSALHYLQSEGISLEWTPIKENPVTFQDLPHMKLQDTVLHTLSPNMGGYHWIDNRGHQVLLDYRPSDQGIAKMVTLQEVLEEDETSEQAIDPAWFQDRLVLIGTTDPGFKDFHRTPVSGQTSRHLGGLSRQMAGVEIHAHMISQLLDIALNGKSPIWSWPQGLEYLWIWMWGIIGAGLGWIMRRSLGLVLSVGIGVLILYGLSYILLLRSGWIPLVPSVICFLTAAIVATIVREKLRFRAPREI